MNGLLGGWVAHWVGGYKGGWVGDRGIWVVPWSAGGGGSLPL